MFNLHLTYRWLYWRRPALPPPSLPHGIERLFVQTPGGPIEILYAKPSTTSSTTAAAARQPQPPVFFVHGGEGSAWVWLEYMTYLSQQGIPCYAVSLRGHGESWCPSFVRMCYLTTRRMLADDLVAGIQFAQEREGGKEVVLVGHSSGGGLSQAVLSAGDVSVRALALVGAVPGFGSAGVYMNWWRLDPLFTIRMLFHGWHPNSPLSHPALTKKVFFHDKVTDAFVEEFQRHISPFESFWWPISMMTRFADSTRVVRSITGWGRSSRVLVLAGGEDKLMTRPVMVRLADYYRDALSRSVAVKKIEAALDGSPVRSIKGVGGEDEEGGGVRFAVVPGVGHHIQNDVGWEVGAQKLCDFVGQL